MPAHTEFLNSGEYTICLLEIQGEIPIDHDGFYVPLLSELESNNANFLVFSFKNISNKPSMGQLHFSLGRFAERFSGQLLEYNPDLRQIENTRGIVISHIMKAKSIDYRVFSSKKEILGYLQRKGCPEDVLLDLAGKLKSIRDTEIMPAVE